jgi:hypothetical protein
MDLRIRFHSLNIEAPPLQTAVIPTDGGYYMAIPYGKKYFAWFTFYKTFDVCVYLNAFTREFFYEKVPFNTMSYGTVLYGTLVEARRVRGEAPLPAIFVAEKVLLFEGRRSSGLYDLLDIVKRVDFLPRVTKIHVATMWSGVVSPIFYNAKTTFRIVSIGEPTVFPTTPSLTIFPFTKSQTTPTTPHTAVKDKTIREGVVGGTVGSFTFYVKADIINDIYHLYTELKGRNGENTLNYSRSNSKVDRTIHRAERSELKYHSIAYIPNYKTSVFMNGIFRHIRENENLDYIEESDTEEDFEDVRPDKYVDLNKIVELKCIYSRKFKKWVPVIASPPLL